jgi:hypothetical protein
MSGSLFFALPEEGGRSFRGGRVQSARAERRILGESPISN